jgi:hypothetical protein
VSGASGPRREFGEGPLARASALVYTLIVVELLLLLATAPGLVGSALIDRDPRNLPLVAVCALPLGPALSAALFALHRPRHGLWDLGPAAAFWRGYRLNAGGVLAIWVPWLGWMTIVATSLAHPREAGVPGWWAALLVLVASGATLWMTSALVITSLFSFRVRDVARLALAFLVRAPGVTLRNACLLALAGGVAAFSSEAVLALLGSVLAAALLLSCRPLVVQVQDQFTAR